MKRTLTFLAISSVVSAAVLNCGEDDSPSPTPDGVDAALDVTTSDVKTSTDSAPVEGSVDASVADVAADVTITDAAVDASDAADAADAAVQLDDAGCPVPSGVVLNAADAGVPSSGLVLWLRNDVGLATKDGGVVCRWEDVSGAGHHFLPGTATPPVVTPNALGTQSAVSFSGSNKYLVRGDALGIAATSGRTLIAYGATQDTTHRFQYMYTGKSGTPGTYFGFDMNTFSTAGSREGVYMTNNSYDSTLATSTNARTHVYTIDSFVPGTTIAGNIHYAVDGTDLALTRNAGGLGNSKVEDISTADFTSIGGGAANFTGAVVGEILVYDRALTTPERNAVEQYISNRF